MKITTLIGLHASGALLGDLLEILRCIVFPNKYILAYDVFNLFAYIQWCFLVLYMVTIIWAIWKVTHQDMVKQ